MIFWRKIVIFQTKYPTYFRASLRSGHFFKVRPPYLKSWIRPWYPSSIGNHSRFWLSCLILNVVNNVLFIFIFSLLIIKVPAEAYSQNVSCMCPKMDTNIVLQVMGYTVNRSRTDNTMSKKKVERANNDLQNTTQTTKDGAKRTRQNTGEYLGYSI